MLRVVLGGLAAFHGQHGAFGQLGQQRLRLAVALVVGALHVHLQEAVELHLLAGAAEGEVRVAYGDLYLGLLHLGVGHLAGHGALPDELVEAALGALGVDGLGGHVGGAYGLVGLLGALGLGLVAAGLDVFGAVLAFDFLLGHAQRQLAQVDAVGTHVGDVSALVQLLCHLHGACHAEAQLAAGLLLQGGGGEGRRRRAVGGLGLDFAHLEVGADDALEEGLGLGLGVEVAAELGAEGLVAVDGAELRRHAEVGLALESLDFVLALHDEAHGHALHAAGAEGGLDFAPEDGADLVAHQAVEHAAGLLGVDEVHVDAARVLDGVEDGRLGNLVEDDALRRLRVELQGLLQVPGDGLSLAVLIGCQPHLLGALDGFLQLADQAALVVAHLVLRLVLVLHVDAHFFLGQVADVAVARLHRVVLAEKFLDGLRLGRRLNNY